MPTDKKNDKQDINIYRPISLLLICEKILGKIVSSAMFKFYDEHKLLNEIFFLIILSNNSSISSSLSFVSSSMNLKVF